CEAPRAPNISTRYYRSDTKLRDGGPADRLRQLLRSWAAKALAKSLIAAALPASLTSLRGSGRAPRAVKNEAHASCVVSMTRSATSLPPCASVQASSRNRIV